MRTCEATAEQRQAAKDDLSEIVWWQLRRLANEIRDGNALGVNPEMSITVSRYGGPALIIDEARLEATTVAKIQDLVEETGLLLELYNGRLNVYSPSWAPDRLPL